MGKKKVSLNIDEGLWKQFTILVVTERGLRKNNEVIEGLIRDYCKGKRVHLREQRS